MELILEAFNGTLRTYSINGIEKTDINTYLDNVEDILLNKLKEELSTRNNYKVALILIVRLFRISEDEITYADPHFRSNTEMITRGTNLSDYYETARGKINESFSIYTERGSGWIFKEILELKINIDLSDSLRASSYIDLPKTLKSKRAIINVKNNDNRCFEYAILSALHNDAVKTHKDRPTSYKKWLNQLSFKGIGFPVSLKDIDQFESQNPSISGINVFGYERGQTYILRTSKKNTQNAINLIMINDEINTSHYCWIKNMSALLASQISKKEHKKFFCLSCLSNFGSEKLLQNHINYCQTHESCKIELPEEGSITKFKNENRSLRVPYVIYADFEAITEKISTCENNPEESSTLQYQKHTPSGFCYYIKYFDAMYKEPVSYRGENTVQEFCNSIEKETKEIYKRMKEFKKINMTAVDWLDYNNATNCHICEEELTKDIRVVYADKKAAHKSCTADRTETTTIPSNKQEWKDYYSQVQCEICEIPLDDIRVKDHCHLTGKYRGAAHNKCNLNYKNPKFIPVIFHNLAGYDAHLFIKQLGKTQGDISCIPNNEEKYISFTKKIIVDSFVNSKGESVNIYNDIRFIDSFKFMASSLDSLSRNLNKEQFNEMKIIFGDKCDILLRKGVYPYDFMDSFSRFDDTTELPPKSEFYSKLNDTDISDEDYKHAENVWKEMGIKDMGEYHDLYLKTDVIILADVFENFRDVCIKNYKLDPAWYYTAPGLSWDALLKKTKIELELLSDIDMILFIEKGIRGGVSMISHRYGKANNKYMGDEYDENEESKYIQYLDANNLYGWAMAQKLPYKDFRWLKPKEIDRLNNGYATLAHADGEYGYIVEVDLEYPTHLHDSHNSYPLAPESLKIGKVEKLVPNLRNKNRYVLHLANLQLYLDLGMKLTKVYKGITFKQKEWMAEYINLNTNLRTAAANDFEKDFFKLMNNSVFGKTMENIRNRVDIQLVCTREKTMKLTSKPNYESRTIFSDSLAAIHMKKIKMKYDKPIYIGLCVLDLSKTLMYDFHYNYMIKKYGDNQTLLFTDTDSLAYEIKTDDFYKDISEDVKTKFDTSNFPKVHASCIKTGCNKKVIGMMKDECGGKQITEFVGLRAKMYSYKVKDSDQEEKRAKGVKKAVIKKDISFNDYYSCLTGENPVIYRKMNLIRSHKHDIFTETVNKVALSANDDKRVIQSDKISTLAYGHYKTLSENTAQA